MSRISAADSIFKEQGFTLIELVIVIIVLGVLAVVAVPKFVSKSGFEDYTVQDQLIARLRLVQLQGMNADPTAGAVDNACYWLVVKEKCFYHLHTYRNNESCSLPSSGTDVCASDEYNQYNVVRYPNNMLSSANYRFDLQGRLIINNNLITTPFEIKLDGDNGLSVNIESEGYIHE
ncbi:prepilin-type N-terminal cleavage/methylation domain-containing protein [Psychromonas ossibalaenae]|uniref:prepilin-type N-terminal cleavage/methylation domain-containing protein n=1 Tax=Psychromonas ossibalaenae TaxID=444922 RepID=UPI000379E6B9|nr:prepilin-type N-terminal cleavage/methylation domain-containing protein [Psychromonas ossibalaenae]